MSSSKSVACGACGHSIRYLESQAGETIRCPKCRASVQLGGATAAAPRAPAAGGGASPGPKQPAWLKDVERIAGGSAGAPGFGSDRPMGLPGTTRIPGGGWGAASSGAPMAPPPVMPVRRSGGMGVIVGSCVVAVLALGGALAYVAAPWKGSEKTNAVTPDKPVTSGASAQTGGTSRGSAGTGGSSPSTQSSNGGSAGAARPGGGGGSDPGQAGSGQASGGGSAPPAQPPEPEPAEPPAKEQGALDPGRRIADQVEVENACEKVVFASSLLGMRDFDERYLTTHTRQEAAEKMWEDFGDMRYPFVDKENQVGRDKKIRSHVFEWAREQAILNSTQRKPPHGNGLYDSRPLFEVAFKREGLPTGVRVTVFVEVPATASKLIVAKPTDPVTCSANVPLATEGPDVRKECCDFNKEMDRFEVPLDLRWNDAELRKLEQPARFTLGLKVVYQDGSEDLVNAPIEVRPPQEVERRYPLSVSCGALVDEKHPWVVKIINELNQEKANKDRGIILSGGGSDDPLDNLMSAYQIWKYLSACGLRYQSLAGETKDIFAQRMRTVHESLSDRNANCVDGAIVFASFYEALGRNPSLVLEPGHAYIQFLVGGGTVVWLDCTRINDPDVKGLPADAYQKPLIKGFLGKYPYLEKERSFATFCAGISQGDKNFNRSMVELEEKIEQFKLLDGKSARSQDEELQWGLLSKYLAISAIHWEAISDLRSWGVKPIGSPEPLGTRYKMPHP